MSETRIVVEQECEHGNVDCYRDHPATPLDKCPGGRRRVLTAGEYLLVEKVDGEWPVDAVRRAAERVGSVRWSESVPHTFHDEDVARAILDALAKSEQEGTE